MREQLMSTATFHTTAPTSADLASAVDAAIRAVRTSGDCGAHRSEAIRLVHRWVAQQDRLDAVHITRHLDAWAVQLNNACRGTGARPVVRVGVRLRTAGF